jgi:hypothetical protein
VAGNLEKRAAIVMEREAKVSSTPSSDSRCTVITASLNSQAFFLVYVDFFTNILFFHSCSSLAHSPTHPLVASLR